MEKSLIDFNDSSRFGAPPNPWLKLSAGLMVSAVRFANICSARAAA
jgi:hypothetical protein